MKDLFDLYSESCEENRKYYAELVGNPSTRRMKILVPSDGRWDEEDIGIVLANTSFDIYDYTLLLPSGVVLCFDSWEVDEL